MGQSRASQLADSCDEGAGEQDCENDVLADSLLLTWLKETIFTTPNGLESFLEKLDSTS